MLGEYRLPLQAWGRGNVSRIYVNDDNGQSLGYLDMNNMVLVPQTEIAAVELARHFEKLQDALDKLCGRRASMDPEPEQVSREETAAPILSAPYRDLAKNQPGEYLPKDKGPAYQKGLAGEQRTAGAIAVLQADKCHILHSVPLSPQKDVDHLVIAPAGVFVLNTKNVTYPVRVTERNRVFVHDRPQSWVESVERDAIEVRSRLHDLVGLDLPVFGVVIVWTGEHALVGQSPNVMTASDFCKRVAEFPRAMTDDLCAYTYSVARRSTTWE